MYRAPMMALGKFGTRAYQIKLNCKDFLWGFV